MAGIGFVLERLLLKGGVRNLLLVAVSGIALVAGPWLLSAASIFLAVSFVPVSVAAPFQQTLVYVFALSLLAFGGLHLTYTRKIADLHYFDRREEERAALYRALLRVALLATALGVVLAVAAFPGVSGPQGWWQRIMVVVMVVLVNVSFLEMIHATQIERFFLVPLGYLAGGAAIVVLAEPLTSALGLSGMYAAFSLGFALVDLLLFLVAHAPKPRAHTPEESSAPLAAMPGARRREQRTLWLAGTSLYLLLWLDKLYYWFVLGEPVAGTGLFGYPIYDIAIFWGQITIIPGLMYYLIAGETDFFRELRRTVRALMNRPYPGVQEQKQRLAAVHRYHLLRQATLQLAFVAALLPVAFHLAELIYPDIDGVWIIISVLLSSAVYLTHYTLFINLLYLRRHREAAAATMVGVTVTLLALLITPQTPQFLGFPFAIGSLAGCISGLIFLERAFRVLDRQLLTSR